MKKSRCASKVIRILIGACLLGAAWFCNACAFFSLLPNGYTVNHASEWKDVAIDRGRLTMILPDDKGMHWVITSSGREAYVPLLQVWPHQVYEPMGVANISVTVDLDSWDEMVGVKRRTGVIYRCYSKEEDAIWFDYFFKAEDGKIVRCYLSLDLMHACQMPYSKKDREYFKSASDMYAKILRSLRYNTKPLLGQTERWPTKVQNLMLDKPDAAVEQIMEQMFSGRDFAGA